MYLQNVQAEFYDSIISENDSSDILTPTQNMIIYRNNVMSNLLNTLLDIYPLVAKLVGEDFFRIVCKEYIHLYPSRSGNLHEYGEYFNDFLSEYPPLKNLSYLSEVAEFEWICHLLHFASDSYPLDFSTLQNISPEKYDQLHFVLNPASRVVKFHYSLLKIIDLCNGQSEEEININEGGNHLLIIRRDFEITFSPLNLAEFTFLNCLADNQNLAEALEQTQAIDSKFDLEKSLLIWIRDKIIVDFS